MWHAISKFDGKEYALKMIEKKNVKDKESMMAIMREKKILSLLQNERTIHLCSSFQSTSALFFVLDLASNGELYQYLHRNGRLTVEQAKFVGAEILIALKYLASIGIVHRDVKPGNILLDDRMHVKLADFGSAKFADSTEKEDFQGTLAYVSPEMLKRERTGSPSDLWSLGILIYMFFN